MSFNPGPRKQAVEVCFSRKQSATENPHLVFNNSFIHEDNCAKHLGLILDKRLSFVHHLKEKIFISNKEVGLITDLLKYLPRSILVCIYKVRTRLDYGDIIYDNPSYDSLGQKLESVKYL